MPACPTGPGNSNVSNNWLFQANPERYDVFADLASGDPIEGWSIVRHRDDIQPGDRAALWVGGPKAGIYAIGTVTDTPREEVTGRGWLNPEDRGVTKMFCPLLLDDVIADRPILKPALRADPHFAGARILSQPQAGNPFLTTDSEWAVIAELRAARSTPRQQNPVWARDELLLALDLYLSQGQLDDTHALVIEVSELLNRLPIHTVRPDLERFRNANGVALRLAN